MTSKPDLFGYLPPATKAPKCVGLQTWIHYIFGGIPILGGIALASLAIFAFAQAMNPDDTQTVHLLTAESHAKYDQLISSEAELSDDDQRFMSIYKFALESENVSEEDANAAKADFFTGISLGVAFLSVGISVIFTEPSARAKRRSFEASESARMLHAKIDHLAGELLYEGPPS